MTEPVALESIMACFQGVIPTSFATCSADGTPNITFLSIVQYVDSERVALSRQFFNKTRANLDVNPYGQARVVDPDTMAEYALDLHYMHTETEGPTFDAMAANLEALASQSGMAGVFRLRGIDVHRVLRCAPVGDARAPARRPERDVLRRLDEFTRRLSLCVDYGEASQSALEALEDLFGFSHSILLLGDEDRQRLFAVASNGYRQPAAGAEVPLGSGLVGVAAQRRQVICVANVARGRIMQDAMRAEVQQGGSDAPGPEIPLPGLEEPQSMAAVPLVVQGDVSGVLFLESERVGLFGPHQERLLRTLGAYLAAALRALEADEPELTAAGRQRHAAPPAAGRRLRLTYYQADDSVFVGEEYVAKGVPGRILWRLARIYSAEGRDTFTNRELRLDESLGLPPGNDNLEARLLVLRKRLAGGRHGIQVERVGRGRFVMRVDGTLELAEVPTSGPMRAAHTRTTAE